MITTSQGIYCGLMHLECDGCGLPLDATLPVVDPDKPNLLARAAIREVAQDHGWTFLLFGIADGKHDLCPRCFQLPPEG